MNIRKIKEGNEVLVPRRSSDDYMTATFLRLDREDRNFAVVEYYDGVTERVYIDDIRSA